MLVILFKNYCKVLNRNNITNLFFELEYVVGIIYTLLNLKIIG